MRRRMEHVERENTGLSKASEAEVMQLFHAFDRDGDGTITVQEFAHAIKKSLRVNLSNKELSALVDEVDRDKDNTVSYSEFISMVRKMDKSKSAKSLHRDARAALVKLSQGTVADPEEHLMAFLGLPSNFRPSVLAMFHKNDAHNLATALDHGALHTVEGAHDANEASVAVFSLKTAFGVPQPDDKRRCDILRRKVRVALFYDPPLGGGKQRECKISGNLYTVEAGWRPEEEDVWRFMRSLQKDVVSAIFAHEATQVRAVVR